jgi:hypothetical protein
MPSSGSDLVPFLLVILVAVAVAGMFRARGGSNTELEARVRRLERSVDRLDAYVGLPSKTAPDGLGVSEDVRDALDAGNKIEAIRRYRQETGVGLKEAKEAVEAYERSPGARANPPT